MLRIILGVVLLGVLLGCGADAVREVSLPKSECGPEQTERISEILSEFHRWRPFSYPRPDLSEFAKGHQRIVSRDKRVRSVPDKEILAKLLSCDVVLLADHHLYTYLARVFADLILCVKAGSKREIALFLEAFYFEEQRQLDEAIQGLRTGDDALLGQITETGGPFHLWGFAAVLPELVAHDVGLHAAGPLCQRSCRPDVGSRGAPAKAEPW